MIVFLVLISDGKLIPIEVKSADNTKAKSLKVYMETYRPEYAIKLSAKNFGFADGKISWQDRCPAGEIL